MQDIRTLAERQRAFFGEGYTRSLRFRKLQLSALADSVRSHEKDIADALRQDLCKSEFEAYETETGIVLAEIAFALKHIDSWARPVRKAVPLMHFPSSSRIYSEPYGSVLIMAPWNYPFQLTMAPLAAALSAGNCAVIKPSPYAPATSAVIRSIISGLYDPSYVYAAEGDIRTAETLLNQKFDFIFFTGSWPAGIKAAKAAAQNLTPICLELGGKSPCIVDNTADTDMAARRIVWGKFLNSGQTCVAPDYVLVHNDMQKKLIEAMRKYMEEFYGSDPVHNNDYPRIISEKHFERLKSFTDGSCRANGRIVSAAGFDPKPEYLFNTEERKIAPTLLTDTDPDAPVMREEIFGPILPVISVSDMREAAGFVQDRPHPLALYLFTQNRKTEKYITGRLQYGGGCVNDTITHLASPHIPFGGIGNSGMGCYHGKYGFDTFSHRKSVLKKSCRIDVPLRYPPYKRDKRGRLKYLALLKFFLRYN